MFTYFINKVPSFCGKQNLRLWLLTSTITSYEKDPLVGFKKYNKIKYKSTYKLIAVM